MPQVPHSHGHMAFPRTQNFDWVLLPHLPQMRFDLSGYHIPEKIEKGRKSRFDCTVVETNIHKPYDSTLLWDAVRVLTRLLKNTGIEFTNARIVYTDHCRRAKRRMLGILNAKNQKQRTKLYKDLLKVTKKTVKKTSKKKVKQAVAKA